MEEYLDFRDDTGFNSPNLRKSAYFSEKMFKKRQKFQAFHGILSDDHGGGISRENGFHGRERERMGFHGRERDFTVEHSIITERNRISQEIRTGENGILQEKTGFYGSKLDWTGEDGRERDFTGENGREWGFTGENGFSRERNGNSRERTGENGVSRERMGFHGRERVFTGEER